MRVIRSGWHPRSAAVFASLDTSLQVSGYPKGTTLDYNLNGSEASLSLPAGAYVLYAELVWGGLYKFGSVDISARTDDAVTFTAPPHILSTVTGENAAPPAAFIALSKSGR